MSVYSSRSFIIFSFFQISTTEQRIAVENWENAVAA